ncbi:MAG TPA: secretin N-terminal domain-containing protein [Gammaproteobacteria bacterium]|nr:secretin N-terminal domain-containing protein [Gammaproteobacteria bacterium]
MVRKIVWLAACSPLLVGGGALAQPREGGQPAGAKAESSQAEGRRAASARAEGSRTASAGAASAETDAAHGGGWTIVVVKLGYARAEEVARLLSQLAPPGVTVAAYEPTNSVVIAGDPAVLGELTNEAKTGETKKAK